MPLDGFTRNDQREPWIRIKYGAARPDDWVGVVPATARFVRARGAPQETLLVLDGSVGQNAVQQGKLFTQAVQPTGLIVTKLDGTARGGAVVALRRELALPRGPATVQLIHEQGQHD